MTDSSFPLNVRGLRGLVLNSRTTTRAHDAALAGVVVPIDGTNYPRTVCSMSMGINPSNEPAHRFSASHFAACDGHAQHMGPSYGVWLAGSQTRDVSVRDVVFGINSRTTSSGRHAVTVSALSSLSTPTQHLGPRRGLQPGFH